MIFVIKNLKVFVFSLLPAKSFFGFVKASSFRATVNTTVLLFVCGSVVVVFILTCLLILYKQSNLFIVCNYDFMQRNLKCGDTVGDRSQGQVSAISCLLCTV